MVVERAPKIGPFCFSTDESSVLSISVRLCQLKKELTRAGLLPRNGEPRRKLRQARMLARNCADHPFMDRKQFLVASLRHERISR